MRRRIADAVRRRIARGVKRRLARGAIRLLARRVRHRLAGVVRALAAAHIATAPSAAALFLAAAVPAAQADPAAWRVTDGRGGELTLLGSMHYLTAADHPLPTSIEQLYERAEALAMELDLDDLDPAAQQDIILRTALLPRGTTLADVLDPGVYALAQRHASDLGVDLALLSSFEPWMVSVALLDQGMSRIGFRPEHGLEQHLLGLARDSRKEIVGLETVETQIGIFDALPEDQQQAMLEQTLQELDSAEKAMGELAAAWRDGRLEELAAQLLQDFDGFPGLYETLVTDRNRRWIDSLERLMGERRRYLVVVGALHLVGNDSVVELLTERGHTVTRLQ